MLRPPNDGLSPDVREALRAKGLDERFTRRALLSGTVSSAAALALTAMWGPAARAATAMTLASRTLMPRPTLLTLVNRLTNGYSEAEYARAQAMGYDAYLASMLTAGVASEPALESLLDYLPNYPSIDLGNRERIKYDVAARSLYYGILSANQWKERMVELWRDHFSVYSFKEPVDLFLPKYDSDVLRAMATANFPDLLLAVEKHGAMLTYLDNQYNKVPIPNENLAREILELHTCSPTRFPTSNSNYTETDVVEFAKCISGWTYNLTTGGFQFKAANHIGGPKTVMGITVLEDFTGPSEGETVLNSLAIPSLPIGIPDLIVPTFVALKLARWFLDYVPDSNVVLAARNQYLTDPPGNPATMVQSLLAEPNVAALSMPSSGGPNLKLRRPTQWLTATLRALQLDTTAFAPALGREWLLAETYRQGNIAYGWPAPDGYPDREEAWAGAIFSRWVGALNLFFPPPAPNDRDVTISDPHLDTLFGSITSVDQAINRLDAIFTGGVFTTNERNQLRAYANAALLAGTPLLTIRRVLCALTVSGPTFNYY